MHRFSEYSGMSMTMYQFYLQHAVLVCYKVLAIHILLVFPNAVEKEDSIQASGKFQLAPLFFCDLIRQW